jgi:hypothetical protein
MTRILNHVRGNLIALIALVVALGGTSYAAINLPAGSVGARQIKNRSITPVKFDPSTINGSVRFWAKLSATGKVIASKPRAHVVVWYSGPNAIYAGGIVNWGRAIPSACSSLVTAEAFPRAIAASAVTATGNGGPGTQVQIATSAPAPVTVAVICP